MTKLTYPFLKAMPRKPQALNQYYEEPKTLGEKGMHAILDEGKKWAKGLATTLNAGGAALFPHTFLSQCGYQIAAVVHAVLDSGSDTALLLGMSHPMSESLMLARAKELNEEDISNEPSWGVLGDGINRDESWKKEFSLDLFTILFDMEVKRRGIKAPRLIVRYPSLVNREPALLPGIEELKQIAKDAVIVGTDDMCHHGIGYGVPPEKTLPIDTRGYQFARDYIQEGYALLENNDYRNYFSHWMNPLAIGDPSDVAVVLKHLVGDASIHILDLKLVDVSTLFENDVAPSWVAATLVEFRK